MEEWWYSRAGRRREHNRFVEHSERMRADRDAFLQSQMEPGEVVLARKGRRPLITNRRILSAHGLPETAGSRTDGWLCESIAFSQITTWTLGSEHDGRPIIKLEHAPVQRIGHIPAHRFLWFEWGNADALEPHTTTAFTFSKTSDPYFVTLRDALAAAPISQGERFVVRLEGTRAERKPQGVPLLLLTPRRAIEFRLRNAIHSLYRGELKWWLRLISWSVLAIPAWFIRPWLALPAIVLAEVGWIVFLQIRWHREQKRQRRYAGR